MSDIKFTPTGNKILLEMDKKQDKTDTGIIIPDTASDTPRKGIIAKLSPDYIKKVENKDENLYTNQLQEGMEVLIGKFSGQDIEIDKSKYKIVSIDEIIGFFNK